MRWFLLSLALMLLVPPIASAQFAVHETLMNETGATTTLMSPTRYERPSNPHTVWYFKLKVTAYADGGNTVRMYFESYDPIDSEWDYWGLPCADFLAATGECVMVFFRDIATDHATLITEDSNDINDVLVVPMPAIWRVRILHSGPLTTSYTVTHWRY
jgi:hypothetical protein